LPDGGLNVFSVHYFFRVFKDLIMKLSDHDLFKLFPRYCFKIPDGYPLELAAPLLCAGITVYTPMMHHKMNQPGKSLGVVGLGGLGHMAVKLGKTFGLNVTVFSTSESKRDEAINVLGVDKFVLSSDTQQMQVLVPIFVSRNKKRRKKEKK
jgi:D-arabinose 1-dehydrogenase-like Zn-dependent alcohol dehydrogenase